MGKRRASIKLTISKDYTNPELSDEKIKSDMWLQIERCLSSTSVGLVIDLNHKVSTKVRHFK
ncbi:MAG: hypothetical protein WC516_08465 [Patescibacteria group bacterium]|jgi:hypothetical protein